MTEKLLTGTLSLNTTNQPSDLRVANVFFLSQFVKFGHRPIVFTNMPYHRYRQARDSDPMTSTGGLAHLGPFRYLVTSEHKTGDKDEAYVPFPISEKWGWLRTYVKRMRPNPGSEKYKYLLFLNSVGHPLQNPCFNLKTVTTRLGKVLSPREIRHAIELALDSLDGKDRDDVSTALCHKASTGRKHYVDSITNAATRGLGLISSIMEGKTLSYTPSSDVSVPREEESVALEKYRPISPAESAASASSEGSTDKPVMPRSELVARHKFINECFTVTTGPLPKEEEYYDARAKNANAFPELHDTSFKKFNECCREIRNKLWAEKVVEDLGRQRFKDVTEGLKRELESKQWFNEKALKLAVTAYGKKVDIGGRMPQHPPVSASVSKTVATASSTGASSGKGSLIDDAVVKGIKFQKWPLARVSGNEKGMGLFAKKTVKKGTVVVDYHGKLLSYADGHANYLADTSSKNAYMYCFQHGSNKYCLDACDPHCCCHPTKILKGRLINHSSLRANLKPKVETFEGRPVLLFQAVRDIAPFEELLFDYKCNGDPHSLQEDWMKE